MKQRSLLLFPFMVKCQLRKECAKDVDKGGKCVQYQQVLTGIYKFIELNAGH